jgi:ABC-type lipoprotein export system ATPase subunit
MHTIKSKLGLRDIDLKIKEGEFICIIGETGSGKTSLLNAIFGEMAFISEELIKEQGGLEAEYCGADLFKMQKKMIQSKIKTAPIVKRGTTAYVE